MDRQRPIGGSDYMMLGFDYELRQQGYAGNSCQIILELATAIPPEALRQRLEKLVAQCPVLNARAGGVFRRRWKLPKQSVAPEVRVHCESPGLLENLLNDPLDSKRGELMRFDLVENADGRMKIIFTWAHALMDAHSAEHFVAVAGREDLPLPATGFLPFARPPLKLSERMKRAWKNFLVFNEFRKTAPRSPGRRHPAAPARLQYRVEKFSAAETAQIRAHATRLSGALGEMQFHTAVSVIELQQLHQRLGCLSPGFVLPVPVGLRPKGNVEPLFSNQITMLMLQLLPVHLSSVSTAITQIKTQTAHAMREGLVEGGVFFLNALRILPLPLYMAFARFGLKGEICSLFYGNTAAVSPQVATFFGVPIEEFTHVAATPVSPGIGIIFYQFHGELRVTVIHLAATLNENEAAQFSAAVRARLLNP